LLKIQVILASIENAILLNIFVEWMRMLKQYCKMNGNYIEWSKQLYIKCI
jgi:hypothetical protein